MTDQELLELAAKDAGLTDRELLELAAKEAGLRVGREPDGLERGRYDLYWHLAYEELVWHGKSSGSEYPEPVCWNPLNDDGDALWLAVTLGLFNLNELLYRYANDPLVDCSKDKYAATRRAIVMAAADV